MPLTHRSNTTEGQASGDLSDLAAGNAQRRANEIEGAVQGGDSVPAFLDSSLNAIADVSPLSQEERDAAKEVVEG